MACGIQNVVEHSLVDIVLVVTIHLDSHAELGVPSHFSGALAVLHVPIQTASHGITIPTSFLPV